MREIVVVGAGIVGISLAYILSREPGVEVIVLERDTRESRGSTTFAPGFVGLYNDVPILTALAQESAAIYDRADGEFFRSGGLELAASENAVAQLRRRVEGAQAVGLPAELLSPDDLPDSVASFVDTKQAVAVAWFPADGSADVVALTAALRNEAIARGARFLHDHEVTGIDDHASRPTVHTDSGDRFTADAVVLAAGVWGPSLAQMTGLELPLFPVAHPYVYSAPASSWEPGPFVRWPEHHVYARVHSDRLGTGTYDHRPVNIEQNDLNNGAGLAWSEGFTPVIEMAQKLLRSEARFVPERLVNGVFAMTPDNLPFLGRHPKMPSVWVAQALWITHAAGAADRLAKAMLNDSDLPPQLRIDRFDGVDRAELRDSALRFYRDIYANDTA